MAPGAASAPLLASPPAHAGELLQLDGGATGGLPIVAEASTRQSISPPPEAGREPGPSPSFAARTCVPDNPEVLLRLARTAYQLSDWPELDRLTKALLVVAPNSGEGVLLAARGASRLQNWAEAARLWQRVCAERPGWIEAWFQFARTRAKLGDDAGERAALTALLDVGDDSPVGLTFKAQALTQIGRLASASKTLARLHGLDPSRALREFARACRDKQPRVIAVYLHALGGLACLPDDAANLVPGTVAALLTSAGAQERSGAFEAAHADYSAVLLIEASEIAERGRARITRMLRVLSDEASEAGDLTGACAFLRRLLACAPDERDNMLLLGRTLMRLGAWEEAIEVWTQLHALDPALFEARLQLARATERAGYLDRAGELWAGIRESELDHPEAAAELSRIIGRMVPAARAALAQERLPEAWRLLRGVLRGQPGNIEAKVRLDRMGRNALKSLRAAYKAGRDGDVAEAADLVADVLPAVPEAQLILGRSFMRLRRYREALAAWEALTKLDRRQRQTALPQMLRCYRQLQMVDEARRAASQILVLDPRNAAAKEALRDLGPPQARSGRAAGLGPRLRGWLVRTGFWAVALVGLVDRSDATLRSWRAAEPCSLGRDQSAAIAGEGAPCQVNSLGMGRISCGRPTRVASVSTASYKPLSS